MSQGGGSIENRGEVGSGPRPAALLQKLVRSGVSFSGRERNCCFANLHDGSFANVSVASGLDLPDDGRGVATVDWDHDGDLDVWLVNRSSPQVRFMKNETPSDTHFLSLKLHGTRSNRDAIGARVELKMSGQTTSQIQTVRAGNAYLSQASRWIHFGTDSDTQIESVKIRWPGQQTEEVHRDLQVDNRYHITQGNAHPRQVSLAATKSNPPAATRSANADTRAQRILLSRPLPLPSLQYQALDGTAAKDLSFGEHATLVNLWATWCQPCLEELAEFRARHTELQSVGINVVALSVDDADLSHTIDAESLKTALQRAQSGFPFDVGQADTRLLEQLQVAHDNLLDLHEPLPIPCSVLLDKDGRMVAIYKGPTSVDQIVADTRTLNQPAAVRREAALPFAGKWSAAPRQPRLLPVALDLLARSDLDSIKEFAQRNQAELAQDSAYAVLLFNIGQQHSRRGEHQQAVEMYKQALKEKPTMAPAYFNLGVTYAGTKQFDTALVCFEQADKHEPGQLDTRLALARTLTNLNRAEEAAKLLADTIRRHPREPGLPFELAITLAAAGRVEAAIGAFTQAPKTNDKETQQRFLARFKNAAEYGLQRIEPSRVQELRRAINRMNAN